MRKKLTAMTAMAISATCAITLSSPAWADQTTEASRSEKAATTKNSQEDESQGFAECASFPNHKAVESEIGKDRGHGISEEVSNETLTKINAGLSEANKKPLPKDTKVLRYLENGDILALNQQGKELGKVERPKATVPGNQVEENGIVHPEVKRIVNACLGTGTIAGMNFETFVRWIATPQNAVRFVIRRIGIVAAIACVGGIIWEYM